MNWQNQQTLLVKLENKYIPLVKRNLERIYREGLAMHQRGQTNDIQGLFFDKQLMDLIVLMYTNSGVAMARYIRKNMPGVREASKQVKADPITGQMGISEQWLLAVREILGRYALEFTTDILGTAREDMVKIFQQATAEGWGYEVIAQKLLREGLALRRSRVIARTEVHRGAMAGSIEGAKSLPYEVKKEWLSGRDNRVRRNPRDRFDHRELSGQQRGIDEPFMNEEPIMFPGDPKASAGNTIQCRCVVSYVPKYDERGRLIRKK